MEYLVYIFALIIVGFVGYFGVKFAKKYGVAKDDLNFAALIIELVDYISGKFEYKYKAGVAKVINLALQAIEFVILVDDIQDGDLIRFKELVFEKTKNLCLAEDIDIDDGLEDILDAIITYAIDKYVEVEKVK